MSLIEQISDVSALSRIFPEHNEAAHRSDEYSEACVLIDLNPSAVSNSSFVEVISP